VVVRVEITVPDDVYEALTKAAERTGQSREEVAVQWITREMHAREQAGIKKPVAGADAEPEHHQERKEEPKQ
jgi:hypothetical protein